MEIVYLNEDILNVCHAVLNYKKFIISNNRVTKKIPVETFDFDKLAEDYFFSLNLPNGMRKNHITYERISRLGLGKKEELASWNSCEAADLSQFVFMEYPLIRPQETKDIAEPISTTTGINNHYTMDVAKWTDYGWDSGIFHLSYGDFVDTDGDSFYFLIEYRKIDDTFVFFMAYENDEIIFNRGNAQTDEFFERHMNRELMETTREYMKKIM